jgi:hypothetical protein
MLKTIITPLKPHCTVADSIGPLARDIKLSQIIWEFSGGVPRLIQFILRGLVEYSPIKTIQEAVDLLKESGNIGRNIIMSAPTPISPKIKEAKATNQFTSILLMSEFQLLFFVCCFSHLLFSRRTLWHST